MPPDTAADAALFAERLKVPVRWWLIAAVGVAIGGAEVFAGFTWEVAVTVYAALAVPVATLLIVIGRARVWVDAAGLHAGGRTLPLEEIASVTALSAATTRHRLGPGADPAAHVLTRGYVPAAVLVRPVHPQPAPYWLVSTRHPERLVAVLARAGALTR
ncbi:MAG TPA: DUF3093 domain-containing protein [Mycobacteriales bacterium]|nr:DUF3093 domain-containing protein [Mycobacteriales bacterium]